MNCDDIAWLVDILGTDDLLKAVCNECDVVTQGKVKPQNGLFFSGAHWYSITNGVSSDSYSAGYQMQGTAHFCQTFAAMIYLGQVQSLADKQFSENIKAAVDFWKNIVENDSDLADWVVKQIKDSYAAESIMIG